MRITFFLMFLLTGLISQAQIKVEKLSKAAIPKSIIFKGDVVDAAKYTDDDGEHIIFTTETGVSYLKGIDGESLKDAGLYAYDYKLLDFKYTLNWKLSDVVKSCEFDAAATYIPKTFAVTDINKDGVAEIWLMYKTTCTSDVSPLTLKIIMHQGNKKYAMRGETQIKYPGEKASGGNYAFDTAFKTAPAAFRNYAINLWNKNMLEKFDQ